MQVHGLMDKESNHYVKVCLKKSELTYKQIIRVDRGLVKNRNIIKNIIKNVIWFVTFVTYTRKQIKFSSSKNYYTKDWSLRNYLQENATANKFYYTMFLKRHNFNKKKKKRDEQIRDVKENNSTRADGLFSKMLNKNNLVVIKFLQQYQFS